MTPPHPDGAPTDSEAAPGPQQSPQPAAEGAPGRHALAQGEAPVPVQLQELIRSGGWRQHLLQLEGQSGCALLPAGDGSAVRILGASAEAVELAGDLIRSGLAATPTPPQVPTTVHMFVDDSNLYYGAQEYWAGSVIQYPVLLEAMLGGRKLARPPVVWGSVREGGHLWSGVEVHKFTVQSQGGEEAVDEALHAAFLDRAAEIAALGEGSHGVLLLVTGDGNDNEGRPTNFVRCVQRALALPTKGRRIGVEVWAWQRSCSSNWRRMAKDGQITLSFFEPHAASCLASPPVPANAGRGGLWQGRGAALEPPADAGAGRGGAGHGQGGDAAQAEEGGGGRGRGRGDAASEADGGRGRGRGEEAPPGGGGGRGRGRGDGIAPPPSSSGRGAGRGLPAEQPVAASPHRGMSVAAPPQHPPGRGSVPPPPPTTQGLRDQWRVKAAPELHSDPAPVSASSSPVPPAVQRATPLPTPPRSPGGPQRASPAPTPPQGAPPKSPASSQRAGGRGRGVAVAPGGRGAPHDRPAGGSPRHVAVARGAVGAPPLRRPVPTALPAPLAKCGAGRAPAQHAAARGAFTAAQRASAAAAVRRPSPPRERCPPSPQPGGAPPGRGGRGVAPSGAPGGRGRGSLT